MVNFLMAYVGSAVARSRGAALSPLEQTVYRPRRTRVTAENQPADAKALQCDHAAALQQEGATGNGRSREMTDAQPSIDEAGWIDTDAPAEGQLVQVRAQDGHGFYVLPFVVIIRDDEWWNGRKNLWTAISPRGGQ
jgi:hypothetical protein